MTKRFTHLHVHTEYSLLDGASKIPELVAYAKELGMDSLAITDHGAMYGAVEFYQECTKAGIKPIIGCEVYLSKGSHLEKNNRGMYHLILLAENDTGYHNLMKIVSIGQLEGFYYKPRVDKDVLRTYHEGVICLSACVAGEVPQMILQDNLEGARRCIQEYIDIFGKENYFLEIQDHDLDEEHKVSAELKQLAQEFGLGLVATNDLHYVQQKDAAAQDILLCIQTTSTVDEPDRMRFNNDSYYLKSYDEMEALFGDCPEALSNTNKIADRCNVKMEFGHLLLPEFPVPEGFPAETVAAAKQGTLQFPQPENRAKGQGQQLSIGKTHGGFPHISLFFPIISGNPQKINRFPRLPAGCPFRHSNCTGRRRH